MRMIVAARFETFPSFLCQADKTLLEKHYEDLKERSFFPGLVKYMASGPVCAMVRQNPTLVGSRSS